MSAELVKLIASLAPTVAEKLAGLLREGRSRDDVLLLVTCLLAEQSYNTVRGLADVDRRLASLVERVEAMCREIGQVNEGVAVLLRRTERLGEPFK